MAKSTPVSTQISTSKWLGYWSRMVCTADIDSNSMAGPEMDDLVKACRSRASFHFLDNPVGVGATTTRPYMLNEWDQSWCPFCSGLGTCLGPGCLGSMAPSVTRCVQLEPRKATEIPGLVGPYRGTTLAVRSLTKKNEPTRISSLKFPCSIKSKRKADAPPNKTTKSTIQVFIFSKLHIYWP